MILLPLRRRYLGSSWYMIVESRALWPGEDSTSLHLLAHTRFICSFFISMTNHSICNTTSYRPDILVALNFTIANLKALTSVSSMINWIY